MKILQINNCHYKRGGADIVYLNTGMLLERRGHEVFYFSSKNEKNIENRDSVYFIDQVDFFERSLFKKITRIPRFIFSTEALRNLDRLIRDRRPDIAHIHFYKGTLTPSILVALRRHKIPTIITVHDFVLFCSVNLCIDGRHAVCDKCRNSSLLNCVINRCNRTSVFFSTVSAAEHAFNKYLIPFHKHFAKIITVSEFSYNEHRDIGKLFPLLTQMYNFYPDLGSRRAKNIRGTYFLLFSRLSREKGILTLLKAWKECNFPDRQLIIAGTGPQENELKSFAAAESLSGVQFVGYKTGNELDALIENSLFVLVPSECFENNPMSIVEAFSLGKPAIGSDLGGTSELIKGTGFLFESGSSLQLAEALRKADRLSDEEYKVMSLRARMFAEEHFSEEGYYNRLIEIYRDAMKRERPN
jgi:glycosyltransferase involved in cell wall biosynthesis